MTKFLFMLLLSASFTYSFSQVDSVNQFSQQDYLRRSKTQKSIATVLVAGGLISISCSIMSAVAQTTKVLLPPYDKPKKVSNAPNALFWTGITMVVASIPVFTSAAANKRKSVGLAFKNQVIPQIQGAGLAYHTIPSLNLKISL